MQTLFQIQEMITKLPDNILMREANKPSGQMPVPMVIQELTRRKELRTAAAGQQRLPPQIMGMAQGGPSRPLKNLPQEILEGLVSDYGAGEQQRKMAQEELLARRTERPEPSRPIMQPPKQRQGPPTDPWMLPQGAVLPPEVVAPTGLGTAPPPHYTNARKLLAEDKPGYKSKYQAGPAVTTPIKTSIGFPKAPSNDDYPDYNDPYAAVIDQLGRPVHYDNPIDATMEAQKARMAAEKPRWGEMGLAAAAALLGTKGGFGKGLGAAFGSVLPYAQAQRADRREDNRYMDQLSLQQAQAAQQNQFRGDDRLMALAEAKAKAEAGKQQYGLGELEHNLKVREQTMKEGYYGSEINKNNAYSAYLTSGGTQGKGPTELQMANFVDGQMADLVNDTMPPATGGPSWSERSYAERFAEAQRRAGLYFGQNTGIAAAFPTAQEKLGI